jgi:hypothetical protein
MDLDGVLANSLFGEEIEHFAALVALELNDIAHLRVLDAGAITGKFLQGRVSS